MASSDLSEELSCTICLNIYTNPVMLTCGHNFCQDCIAKLLDRQQESGVYTCPDCRAEFQQCPSLERNLKLWYLVEEYRSTQPKLEETVEVDHYRSAQPKLEETVEVDHYRSTQPKLEETVVFCTYCVDSSVPAVKTCLHCEAFLCDIHVKTHSKSENHILTDPTVSVDERKCSVHNELLKFFCCTDSTFICVTCCLVGEHSGHQVEMLNEAFEKKKVKLCDFLMKVYLKKGETEKQLHRLQERKNRVQEKATGFKDRVTALFGDIRGHLAVLENTVLNEVTRQEKQVLHPLSDLIQKLEIETKDQHEKILQIKRLCSITDPLTLLKEGAIDSKPGKAHYSQSDPAGDDNLDEVRISVTLQRALNKLSNIVPDLKAKRGFRVGDASDMILNVNTADTIIALSQDLKNASYSQKEKSRPHHPERFTTSQVLSTRKFASGQHYWEVRTSNDGDWSVGVTYNSVKRKGDTSFIGQNSKSWCLTWVHENEDLKAEHDNDEEVLYTSFEPVPDLGIYLDYERGLLSFYKLSEPITHLHTFTATFTEALHAAFYVNENSWIKIKS
ncbi:E3 ubiquitin/ISG15 ligase TRIM25-like [Ascaphus truei]|uniref:E3 ubiquitin/ISG15 ligase TRIM25-like n=1 Tax=Ascaphus truei TaxID=8439 RepID=UPI003F599314